MLEQPYFGRQVKRLRLSRGLSQASLAGEGMSTGYLSRLESGERRPTERAAVYLAERLNVDLSSFEQGGGSLSEAIASVTSAPAVVDSTGTLMRAIDEDQYVDPAARWQALWLVSRTFNQQGDHEQELRCLTELVELSDSLKIAELQVRARVLHTRCLRALGDVSTARPVAAEALKLARGSELLAADVIAALMVLISVEAESGALDRAVGHCLELEEEWLPQAAPTQAAEALWTTAVVHSRRGDFESAEASLRKALDLLDRRSDLTLWLRLRAAATAVALQMKPPALDNARHWLREIRPAVKLIGTGAQMQEVRSLEAHLAFHEGRLDDARQLCEELLDSGELRLAFRDRVRLSALAGQLMILNGEYDRGIETLQKMGQEAVAAKNVALAAQVWETLATALAEARHNGGLLPTNETKAPDGAKTPDASS
ncbi:helix-turn-helix domain-containing protein [Streptomyces nigra]|uniref:helix-turn-helix domain-containing protein n=1 Tax=Streptomyces nigra TaxID=1827580 RepID=UPI0036B0760B